MNRISVTSASFLTLLSVAANAATLAPHRAYYDLTAKRVEAGGSISTVTGKLAYEIVGSSCDGFAVNYRVANRIKYTEGGLRVIDNQMTSWESGDGLQLDITQKQFVDSVLTSESRIKVAKESAATPGKGLITKADTKDFETAASAIFPTRFAAKLVDVALSGVNRDVSVVFEGSDDDKSVTAISFFGARRTVTGLPEKDAGNLAQAQAWPVSVSYYSEAAQDDEPPIYQANFLMLDNGISTELTLDYGTYALSGKLTKLELLKPETCPGD